MTTIITPAGGVVTGPDYLDLNEPFPADESGPWEVDAMRPLALMEPERPSRAEVVA